MRIEGVKSSSKKFNDACKYCEKFENTVRFSTANCLKEFRWFGNRICESEKINPINDTNGRPFCCACVECEERITIYYKALSETPNSTIISNRRSRLKTELYYFFILTKWSIRL